MKAVFSSLAFAGLSLAAVGSAHAYTTYFGEDFNNSASTPLSALPMATAAQQSFLGNFTSAGVENFESQATGATAPLTLGFAGGGGTTINATLTGGGGKVVSVAAGTAAAGRYSVPSASSTKFWEVTAGGAAGAFTVTFEAELAGFGFFGVDVGDFGGALFIDLFDDTGALINTQAVPNRRGGNDGSVLYFGVLAANDGEMFKSIRFRSTGGTVTDDVFAFDNFTIAQKSQLIPPATPVPEPASLALVAAALLGLGVSRRRS